jgi:predicted acylesterase/phospholipase RssA/CRP-like cAMP-binding protein
VEVDRADDPPAATLPWPDTVRTLQAGELLVGEGDTGSEVFLVVEGTFEVLRGPDLARIAVVGAGATVGEIAALAGCPRTATVRALEPSVVRQLDGATCQRLLADDAPALDELATVARRRIDRHRAIELVGDLLHVDARAGAEVVDSSEIVHVLAGDVLFTEGDDSDAGYLVVSGRFAVSRRGATIGEIARGEIIGEVGLFERAPRSATVTALRDSTLARFSIEAFRALTETHPRLMLQLTRTIVGRLTRPHHHRDRARSIAIAVTTQALEPATCVAGLADEIARHGSAVLLSAARVDAALGRPGLVESGLSVTRPAVAEYLHEAETNHDYLVLEADPADTRWTRMALAMADRFVVVTSADADEAELGRVADLLSVAPPRIERWLVLVHRSDPTLPVGTAALADRFGFHRTAHLRRGSAADVKRLARLVSGTATGLVLGGGGARGFAHLGVWKALQELGVDIDTIGGASIGAPLGALMAMGLPPGELEPMVIELFHDLLDYTVPLVSLIKGERISRNIAKATAGIDIRELWVPFFCVSTNLTRSQVQVHDRFDAATAIRASVAIPGILPPVAVDGDLLVDGGVLNNLPCDVMRSFGTIGRLIAVDLSPAVGPQVREDFGPSVSGWKALQAHLSRGPSKFPGLMAILMRALVAGSVRDRDRLLHDGTVDWYLDLELSGVHLLDFERVREIAARGYAAAQPRLEALLAADAG